MSYNDQITEQTLLKSNMNKQYACVITYRNRVISAGYNYDKCGCSLNKQSLL